MIYIYIFKPAPLKPEVVAVDRRRCGLIKDDARRDFKAVERQMDHVGRL